MKIVRYYLCEETTTSQQHNILPVDIMRKADTRIKDTVEELQ